PPSVAASGSARLWTRAVFLFAVSRSWHRGVLARRKDKNQRPRPEGSRECLPDRLTIRPGRSHLLPQFVQLVKRRAIVVAVRNHYVRRFANQPARFFHGYVLQSGLLHQKDNRPFGLQ